MKRSKLYEAAAITIAIAPYFFMIYLVVGQFYDYNFLIKNASLIFVLSLINLLNILKYYHTKYYIEKGFFFKTHYKTKEDVVPKKRKETLTRGEVLVDKITRCNLTSLHICLLAIELWAIAQYRFNVHNIIPFYYKKQSMRDLMFLTVALMLTANTLLLFLLYNFRIMFGKSEYSKTHEHCFLNSRTSSSLLISTDSMTTRLLSSPESSPLPCNISSIPLLPSPTPSSDVFLFPSAPSSPILKLELNPELFSAEDIMPKLLDNSKSSSSGIGSSIRSLRVSKSKIRQASSSTEDINMTSIPSQPSLFSYGKVVSLPNLYEEEPLESAQNQSFANVESWIQQSFINRYSSSSPNLALKLSDNDTKLTPLSIKRSLSSLYREYIY